MKKRMSDARFFEVVLAVYTALTVGLVGLIILVAIHFIKKLW